MFNLIGQSGVIGERRNNPQQRNDQQQQPRQYSSSKYNLISNLNFEPPLHKNMIASYV